MTPVGIGAAILAIYLAFSGLRFWWHGLVALLSLSLIFAVIIVAELHLSGDRLPLAAPLIFRAVLFMPIYMLVFYGIAASLRWAFGKLRRVGA